MGTLEDRYFYFYGELFQEGQGQFQTEGEGGRDLLPCLSCTAPGFSTVFSPSATTCLSAPAALSCLLLPIPFLCLIATMLRCCLCISSSACLACLVPVSLPACLPSIFSSSSCHLLSPCFFSPTSFLLCSFFLLCCLLPAYAPSFFFPFLPLP